MPETLRPTRFPWVAGKRSGDVTEFIYANDTFDNSWLTFRPEAVENAKKIATGEIYAAEYMDGYVFTIEQGPPLLRGPFGGSGESDLH